MNNKALLNVIDNYVYSLNTLLAQIKNPLEAQQTKYKISNVHTGISYSGAVYLSFDIIYNDKKYVIYMEYLNKSNNPEQSFRLSEICKVLDTINGQEMLDHYDDSLPAEVIEELVSIVNNSIV